MKNTIPEIRNPQQPASPALGPLPLGVPEAKPSLVPPPRRHSFLDSAATQYTSRKEQREGSEEGEFSHPPSGPPPPRGLARAHSPPRPAPFSRPGRASLLQPSPASAASPPPPAPAGRVAAGSWNSGTPASPASPASPGQG